MKNRARKGPTLEPRSGSKITARPFTNGLLRSLGAADPVRGGLPLKPGCHRAPVLTVYPETGCYGVPIRLISHEIRDNTTAPRRPDVSPDLNPPIHT